MEIDQVKEGEHPEDWSKENQEVNEEEGWWIVNDSREINCFGNKAYGKSKGKGGQRFQQKGGKSSPSWSKGKGESKGKGKGAFDGKCYNCGKQGHSAKFCTEAKKFNFECSNGGKK